MAKTKPIGVRFDEDMLRVFKEDGIADSPQKTLNFLSGFYLRNRHHENGGFDFTELLNGIKLEKHKESQKQIASTIPLGTTVDPKKISELTVCDDNEVVDYQKLFNECEFDEERKILWERMKIDPVLNEREKKTWKLRLGIR